MLKKVASRKARHKKIRSRVIGTAEKPRLSVFKSNKFIYAQIINDAENKTVVSANDVKDGKGTKTERAVFVGTTIADLCKKANITNVVFDRGGFAYAGRIKTIAEAARNAGLEF